MIDIMFDWSSALPRKELAVPRSAHLFHGGDRVRTMFLVRTGQIILTRHSDSGAALVLQRAGPGAVVAEASLFSATYHCDALAVTDAVVFALPRADFLRRLDTSPEFARAWATHLSQEVRRARGRAEILSLRTVAERLDAWLSDANTLPDKGGWKILAAELGTSPEALYREIARRRRPLKRR